MLKRREQLSKLNLLRCWLIGFPVVVLYCHFFRTSVGHFGDLDDAFVFGAAWLIISLDLTQSPNPWNDPKKRHRRLIYLIPILVWCIAEIVVGRSQPANYLISACYYPILAAFLYGLAMEEKQMS